MRHVILAGCLLAATTLISQTTLESTIQSGGITRQYRMYIPAAYNPSTPVPVLLNLHGYGSNNAEQQYYGAFQNIADTANFLILLPNGTLNAMNQRQWNNFEPPTQVDDVQFISDLLDSISATYNVDAQRVYSTGMSNGGFMSYELACKLNNRIAAIASVTGSMTEPRLAACQPTRPVPVMQIHGTADAVVPYSGSTLGQFTPIEELVNKWVDFNDCQTTPTITDVPNTSTTDGCTAQRRVFGGGFRGSSVEFYRIENGGHTWPGSFFIVGVTNQDFEASLVIWRFLSKYRLDQLSSTDDLTPAKSRWTLTPNPASEQVLLQTEDHGAVRMIRVFDSRGTLKSLITPPVGAPVQFSVAGWPAGVYIVQIEQAGQWNAVKMVVR
jgi:polyhydroxybutyrate depolymerase